MTYQAPMNPSMQPQAPPPPPPADDAARGKFISLMKSINPETDLMFGRLQGYRLGGVVEGLGTLGTLEEDPLGTLGDLGIPETPKAPLPAATPFPVQGKIGVPGFKGQFFKEEDVRGTRFPAFAPALRAEVEEESTRGVAGIPTIVRGADIRPQQIAPIGDLGMEIGKTLSSQIGETLSPYYEELKEGLKAGTYDVLKGTEAGDNLIEYLGIKPDFSDVPESVDFSSDFPAAETDPYTIATRQAAAAAVPAAPDALDVITPSPIEAGTAALEVLALREAGVPDEQIALQVGGKYGAKKAIEYMNLSRAVGDKLPAGAIAAIAPDLLREGKITAGGASAAVTNLASFGIKQAMLSAQTTALGMTPALYASIYAALPGIAVTALQMHQANKAKTRAKQNAEIAQYTGTIHAIGDMLPHTWQADMRGGEAALDFATLEKAVGLADPVGTPSSHLGMARGQAGRDLLLEYPQLIGGANIDTVADQSLKGAAARATGRLAVSMAIPGVKAAFDQLMRGQIRLSEFKSQSQAAFDRFKNSDAYQRALRPATVEDTRAELREALAKKQTVARGPEGYAKDKIEIQQMLERTYSGDAKKLESYLNDVNRRRKQGLGPPSGPKPELPEGFVVRTEYVPDPQDDEGMGMQVARVVHRSVVAAEDARRRQMEYEEGDV